MKLTWAFSGGYDRAARELPAETRAAVIERDGRRCVLCRNPGTDVDHIDGDSPDLSNLRLLCSPCHNAVTWSHVTGGRVDDPEVSRIFADSANGSA